MAQMAEKLPLPEFPQTPLTPVGTAEIRRTGVPLNLAWSNSRAGSSWLAEAARQIGAACGTAKGHSAEFTTNVRNRTRAFSTLVRGRVETVKDEQPLKIIAVLAGIAAVAGIATRVWRSSRYE